MSPRKSPYQIHTCFCENCSPSTRWLNILIRYVIPAALIIGCALVAIYITHMHMAAKGLVG